MIHVVWFFPHIQGFKSNQGSHVILVALICSINIEPFRKNRESKKLNLALGLRVTSNSATLKFTREEPPSGLLTLRMPEPTVDPTNYWNQSRPMILRQNIPEFYQVRFAMDPTLSNISLRWILLCPTLVCDGTYPNPSQSASGETDWKPRTCLKQFGGFCAICLKWMW